MFYNNLPQNSFLECPQLFFTILLTLKQNIPDIEDLIFRPSEFIEFMDSHDNYFSEDLVSHITVPYANSVCYHETQDFVESNAMRMNLQYEYVDAVSVYICMEQIMREALLLDRFPGDLSVHWAIYISDGILSAGIIDISDDTDNTSGSQISCLPPDNLVN